MVQAPVDETEQVTEIVEIPDIVEQLTEIVPTDDTSSAAPESAKSPTARPVQLPLSSALD